MSDTLYTPRYQYAASVDDPDDTRHLEPGVVVIEPKTPTFNYDYKCKPVDKGDLEWLDWGPLQGLWDTKKGVWVEDYEAEWDSTTQQWRYINGGEFTLTSVRDVAERIFKMLRVSSEMGCTKGMFLNDVLSCLTADGYIATDAEGLRMVDHLKELGSVASTGDGIRERIQRT
jgi:hypothetical protein